MNSLLISGGAIVVLAVLGVAIVSLTFRAARAVRVARPHSPREWVERALPSPPVIRTIAPGQFEAEANADEQRWRITWSAQATHIELRSGAQRFERRVAGPPGRGLRAEIQRLTNMSIQG